MGLPMGRYSMPDWRNVKLLFQLPLCAVVEHTKPPRLAHGNGMAYAVRRIARIDFSAFWDECPARWISGVSKAQFDFGPNRAGHKFEGYSV